MLKFGMNKCINLLFQAFFFQNLIMLIRLGFMSSSFMSFEKNHTVRLCFVDDFGLIGDFQWQLLVYLATKEHREISFPIDLYGKL